jgi:hypothetical protein
MAGNPRASLPGLPQRPSLARSSASATRLTQPGIEGARSRKLNSAPTAAFRFIAKRTGHPKKPASGLRTTAGLPLKSEAHPERRQDGQPTGFHSTECSQRRLSTRGSSRRRTRHIRHILGRPGNCGRMGGRCWLGTGLLKSCSPGAPANDADLGILGRPSHWRHWR